MGIIMITHDLGVVAEHVRQDRRHVRRPDRGVRHQPTRSSTSPSHPYTKGLLDSIPKLDTEEHERLVPIEGTPVDLLNPPSGCPFAPRCEHCMKICLSKMPPEHRAERHPLHRTAGCSREGCNLREGRQGGMSEQRLWLK